MTPLALIRCSFQMPVLVQPLLLSLPEMRSDFDLLSDQSSRAETLANRFKAAFEAEAVAGLNVVIKNIIENNGQFTVTDQLKQLMLDEGIELNQRDDGQVSMGRYVYGVQPEARFEAIQNSLSGVLPMKLINIVSAFDEQIAIEMDNKPFILDTLMSGDRSMQRKIFEYAIVQGRKDTLNEILTDDRWNYHSQDLSNIDLSGLDLSGLHMQGVVLDDASLKGSNLRFIDLLSAKMKGVDLSGSDLTYAELTDVDLSGASLAGALMGGTNLEKARLIDADLTGATLTGCSLTGADLSGAILTESELSDDETGHDEPGHGEPSYAYQD